MYGAIHKTTDKPVAIKILKKIAIKQGELEHVKREIEVLKLCQHPNIGRLLDVFENHEQLFIVMEQLQGDLFHYMERRSFHISEERAATLFHSIATALYYLHTYGIVHRDLKLENIMMADETEDSDVKLVDFGLSKIIGPKEKCAEPYGTIGMAAPEVLKKLPYDKRADIWSLGSILYVLLCGKYPFEDEEQEEVIRFVFPLVVTQQ